MRVRLTLPLLVLTACLAIAFAVRAQAQMSSDPRLANAMPSSGGYLGVMITDIDADRVSRLKLPDERGVEIVNVEEGSPADNAGLRIGDVLLTYNGEAVLGGRQFVRLVRETPAARKVRISYWRNGKEQSAVVVTANARTSAQNRPFEDNGYGVIVPGFGNAPDGRGLITPDYPTVLMVWNSSALGIEFEPLESQLAQYFGAKQGVLVRSVSKGAVADKAGLKVGDVVTAAGNRPVRSPEDFRRILKSTTKALGLLLMRDRKEVTLTIPALSDRDY